MWRSVRDTGDIGRHAERFRSEVFRIHRPWARRGGVILLRLLDRQVARIEEAEDLLARSGREGGHAGASLACRRPENP